MTQKQYKAATLRGQHAMEQHRKEVRLGAHLAALGDFANAADAYVRASQWLTTLREVWRELDFKPKPKAEKLKS